MKNKDKANIKHLAAGCLAYILLAIVVGIAGDNSAIEPFIGIIVIFAIFLLGAFLTEAFGD